MDDRPSIRINDPVLSIGILADRVRLSVSTVRKYENEGLMIAHRTDSGHRLFSQEDITRARNIHHLIRDLGFNVEGMRRLQALLPCWDLRPCSEENCSDCPAHADNTRPCWMIMGMKCAPQGNECRECAVYRFGSLCTEQIKSVVYGEAEPLDAGLAIRELLRPNGAAGERES